MNLAQLKTGSYSGGALVTLALEWAGITHTFGIPGTHNIELYDALVDSSVMPILVTDEQSASFMADGMARSGGALPCVNIVPGAGLTHALSGIAEAYMDNIPLLVLLCGVRKDISFAYQLHDIDQIALIRPVVKHVFCPQESHEVVTMILEAAELAKGGCPGPVAIEISADFYLKKQPFDAQVFAQWHKNYQVDLQRERPILDQQQLQQAIEMLKSWKKPLIHIGLGAKNCQDLLVPLATKLGAVVSSTFSGKGIFPETHPHWLWPGFGNACPRPLKKIAESCDGILILGARMGEVSTASFGVKLPEQSIQVDIAKDVAGRNFPVDLNIQADAKVFVRALMAELEHLSLVSIPLQQALATAHQQVKQEQSKKGRQDCIAPSALFQSLQLQLPASTIYVTDSGNGTFFAMESLRLNQGGHFLAPTDFSCMGYCVPASIGAALAHPGQIVVALPGDGALLMTGLEWITAAYHQLPILFFVLRDEELGQIAAFQKAVTNRTPGSVLPPYHLQALAQVADLPFFKLAHSGDIDSIVEQAYQALLAHKKPVVVEVAIDYSQKTYFTKGVIKTNFMRLSWTDRYHMVSRALGRKFIYSK